MRLFPRLFFSSRSVAARAKTQASAAKPRARSAPGPKAKAAGKTPAAPAASIARSPPRKRAQSQSPRKRAGIAQSPPRKRAQSQSPRKRAGGTRPSARRSRRRPSGRSSRTPRLTTVEAARVLHVPRIVAAVREQRRRHRDVMRLCQVKASQVRVLARRLGVRLPSSGASREKVAGAPADVATRNVCHILGTAMSMLFKGERNYAYPVRVAGSGVAGLAFFMSDGTVIKTSDLHLPGKQRSDRGGLVPGRGRSIPEREFLHEVAMTRAARRRFGGSSAFTVPRVPRAVILRGPKGARVGVMQQTLARGMTVAAFLRATGAHSQAARMAAARAHGRAVGTLHAAGWAHGDPHTENTFVHVAGPGAAPRITLIDWGRSYTRRLLERHAGSAERSRALWAKSMRYESAWPYRDMATHGPGRPAADAYLEGYLQAARSLVREGTVDPAAIRADYVGLVENNVGAMFTALDLVSRGEARAKGAAAPAPA